MNAIAQLGGDGVAVLKLSRSIDVSKLTLGEKISWMNFQAALLKKSGVPDAEKASIRKGIEEMFTAILETQLVYDPRGAYLSVSLEDSRVERTAGFIRIGAELELDA